MIEKRQHQRINCAEKCLLYHAQSRYSGAVMDISISGALVTVFGPPPTTIKPGDTCSLVLSNNQASSFFKYKSRIARVNSSHMGVEILEHEL